MRGGITVMVQSPEVTGLQRLIRTAAGSPGDPLANAYRAVRGAGPQLSLWPGLFQYDGEQMSRSHQVAQLMTALGFAKDIWEAQEKT